MKPDNAAWVERIIDEHVAMIQYAGKWDTDPPKVAQSTWTEVLRERNTLQQTEQNRERAEHFAAMRKYHQDKRKKRD